MVRIEPEQPRSIADERYWLSHCEGFRVESPSGRVGTVERIVFDGRDEQPQQLSVCSGLLRLRSKLIPVDEIAAIAPRELRLTVRQAPAPRAALQGERQTLRRRMLHPMRG